MDNPLATKVTSWTVSWRLRKREICKKNPKGIYLFALCSLNLFNLERKKSKIMFHFPSFCRSKFGQIWNYLSEIKWFSHFMAFSEWWSNSIINKACFGKNWAQLKIFLKIPKYAYIILTNFLWKLGLYLSFINFWGFGLFETAYGQIWHFNFFGPGNPGSVHILAVYTLKGTYFYPTHEGFKIKGLYSVIFYRFRNTL